MRAFLAFLVLSFSLQAFAQNQQPATLRSILLAQLRSTHNSEEWFVPVNVAVDGLTADQANWKDGKGNHSVGQLAYHLLFWNRESLAHLKGETPAKFSGNNNETFDNFDSKQWADTVKQLDQVMTDIEKFVETADEKTLQADATRIAHISTHNAYHVGQMIYSRKLQGVWNPEKGVK